MPLLPVNSVPSWVFFPPRIQIELYKHKGICLYLQCVHHVKKTKEYGCLWISNIFCWCKTQACLTSLERYLHPFRTMFFHQRNQFLKPTQMESCVPSDWGWLHEHSFRHSVLLRAICPVKFLKIVLILFTTCHVNLDPQIPLPFPLNQILKPDSELKRKLFL